MGMPALPPSSPSSLRLFAPDEQPTLLQLYENRWLPKRSKSTAANDRECLRAFERCTGARPAATLSSEQCWQFRREQAGLVKSGQLASATANKRIRTVNLFLKLLGPNDGSIDPQDEEQLQPAELLGICLNIKQLEQQRNIVTKAIHSAESEQFLTAAARFHWRDPADKHALSSPPSLPATEWWRAVWLLCYNTALRIDELLTVRWEHQETDCDGTWWNLPATVTKTGAARYCYLNRHALAQLAILKRLSTETVLGWTYTKDFLQKLRLAAFNQAGLHRLVRCEIGWHGLRKACAIELAKLGGGQIAGMHLGHAAAKGDVTTNHYLDRTVVVPHVDRLPQPRIIEPTDPQQRLFE
jgi:integrase